MLKKSRRGHSYDDVVCASKLINEFGFELGLQMMLGLVGDTAEKSLKTARDIISLSPKTARIYPTIVIRDSALEVMYNRGEYEPLALDDAVSLCAKIYTMFTENNIEVLRMGLMASEDMHEGRGIVAGPFHPSFGELVFSKLYLDKMRSLLHGYTNAEAVLCVNPRDLSKALGNKRSNIDIIKNEQGVKISLKCDEKVERGQIVWYNEFNEVEFS